MLARVDDLDVDTLAVTRTDVGGDDDKRARVRGVPDALRWGIAVRGDVELDGGGGLGEADEQGDEEQGDGA